MEELLSIIANRPDFAQKRKEFEREESRLVLIEAGYFKGGLCLYDGRLCLIETDPEWSNVHFTIQILDKKLGVLKLNIKDVHTPLTLESTFKGNINLTKFLILIHKLSTEEFFHALKERLK